MGLLAQAGAAAQGLLTHERFAPGAADSTVLLAHELIVPGSMMVMLDTATLPATSDWYTLNARFGLLVFGPRLRAMLAAADTARRPPMTVAYRYRPLLLPRDYARRRLVTVADSAGPPRVVAQATTELSTASIFGRNFQRSGSIVRGFTVGSNRDLTLQSGLRLQFSGLVADSVEVLGALTDEETPIQPEGNTQTLREVDNIFMEIRSPAVGATLGKFVADNSAGGYLAYSRKLQGVKAEARWGGIGTTSVVAAVSPGRFRTQVMQGRERDQGPYRLTGQNNERNIVVVAGTEHVVVDGVAMMRGEREDYVIDYSTGEIFFQTRRPITSLSRIVVDFEYTDRQYSRSFVAARHSVFVLDSALSITAGYVREADNPDATVDISLNDADRAILANAGGSRERAVRGGATYVGSGDSVAGTYIRVDTVINGRPDSLFRYVPGDSAARYNVVFSAVPAGAGDYRYVAFGRYDYAGPGGGNYMPVVYLPLPELRQVASLAVRARPSRAITVDAQAAFSDASFNRLSTLPGASATGLAASVSAAVVADSASVGGAMIGGVRATLNAQYLGAGFRTVERLGDADFAYRWNTGERLGETSGDVTLIDGALTYTPVRRVQLQASEGYLSVAGVHRSFRQQYGARFVGDTTLPTADYTAELINSDTLGGLLRTAWLRQRGGLGFDLGPVYPAIRAEWERRTDRAGAPDSLAPASFRSFEWGPELIVRLPFLITSARARFRAEDSVRADSALGTRTFVADGSAATFTVRGELRGLRDFSSTLDVTYRRRSYLSVPGIGSIGRLDNTTLLARSQTRFSAFDRGLDMDASYDVQTEQAARLQRLFVKVPFGRGEYTWTDLNADGLQTEDEFRIAFSGEGEYVRYDVPTEQLYPVIDLRASTRLRIQARRLVAPTSPLGAVLAPVTAETYLRIEEKSQSQRESDVYLLRLSAFQNDSTTIVGNATVQQDVNLFESNPEYSFRLRYLSRAGLTRLVSTVERTTNVERSLRIRWQPTYDIGIQFDLGFNNGGLGSTDTTSTRRYDLSGTVLANDFSYRPEQSLELGWGIRLALNRDVITAVPRTTQLNTNTIRAVYSIETRGRLRGEIERTNVSGTNIGDDVLTLPYQLTDGYAIGTTWIARATFEYRFGANIQASLTYTGRAQPPTMQAIHIGQAEVRAFF